MLMMLSRVLPGVWFTPSPSSMSMSIGSPRRSGDALVDLRVSRCSASFSNSLTSSRPTAFTSEISFSATNWIRASIETVASAFLTEQLDRLFENRQTGLVALGLRRDSSCRRARPSANLAASSRSSDGSKPRPAGTAAIDKVRPSGWPGVDMATSTDAQPAGTRGQLAVECLPQSHVGSGVRAGRLCGRPGLPERHGAGTARRPRAQRSSCRCPKHPKTQRDV